jgi:hypothetical protein
MDIAFVDFISHSTARDTYVELGFVPDYVEVIVEYGGTAPDRLQWANGGAVLNYPFSKFPNWAAGQCVRDDGADGITEQLAAGIYAYAGGETIASAESVSSNPKHVDRNGDPAAAGHVTAQGILVMAAAQVNSGRNFVIAMRGDR